MRVVIEATPDDVSTAASEHVIAAITRFAPTAERPFVIGLPTGGTPVKTYQKLIQAHREGRISFKHVVSFNMDEYVGLPREHPESYHSFMYNNFFNFIDIERDNVNILNGNAEDLAAECQRYEDKIARYGGIELFMGGLGHDGHIAFNEPGSSLSSRTRVKSLNHETIEANARFFDGKKENVPTLAVTVGIGTIMDAREVLFLVTGVGKAKALSMCIEESITHMWTGSALQMHKRATFIVDEKATMELRVRTVNYFKDLQHSERELQKRQEALKKKSKL